jgi:hypothetical protein
LPIDSVASERDLIGTLLDTFHELPNLRADLLSSEAAPTSAGYRPDAEIALQESDSRVLLSVEAERELYPRDVREVVWRRGPPNPASVGPQKINFIAANSISPGAKVLLKAESVGYYDRGGILFITAPGAYIYVDKPPPKSIIKAIRSLFSGRRAQVIHALLLHHGEWVTGKDLADGAGLNRRCVAGGCGARANGPPAAESSRLVQGTAARAQRTDRVLMAKPHVDASDVITRVLKGIDGKAEDIGL